MSSVCERLVLCREKQRRFQCEDRISLSVGRQLVRGEGFVDEIEAGKQKFLDVVKAIDGAVQVVIPVTPSNSMFLISVTKGANRKFMTVPEDDIIDLPTDAGILAKVTKTVRDAIAAL
jgi:hypothetical protein